MKEIMGELELGAFSVSLSVRDIDASCAFYEKLEFSLSSPVMMALWTLIPTPTRARRVRLSSVEKVLKHTGFGV